MQSGLKIILVFNLFDEDADVSEMVTRLSGAILRKAEIEEDFLKVYTNVFEKLAVFPFFEEVEVLEVFGMMGG